MMKNSQEQQTLVSSERTSRLSPLVVSILIFYSIVMVSVSVVAGFWLYGWARNRIVQTALPVASNLQPGAQAEIQSADGSATESTAVEASQPAAANAVAVAPAPAAINILLMGTDARANENGPPRTDTLILLMLDPATQTAGMLSLPRDLWVPIPGFDTNKINLAYAIGEEQNYRGGGPQLVKDTISSFIGQPVQYYVRVNFHGFVELIDLIGGVEVQLPTTIHDEEYPTADYGVETFHLDAGLKHLDGETALKYARTRHVDDDYGRARRQQDLLKAVLDKVLNADMIPTLLAKLPQLMYTMRSSIDTDIPMATGLELANYARLAAPKEIRQLVLDSRYGEETYSADGAWILLPDRSKVRAAVEQFFQPPTASQSGSSSVALADPKTIRIEILNGTDEPGVAAQTRALLEARGWQVVAIGDADRHDYGRTLVINYGVSPTLVQEVSADLNLQPSLSSLPGLNTNRPIDMRIVVGNDILPTVR